MNQARKEAGMLEGRGQFLACPRVTSRRKKRSNVEQSMIRKISRHWDGQDTIEIISERRHRVLAAPATVLFLAYIFMFHSVGSTFAQSSITLAWDSSTDPGLGGYNIYRSEQSGVFGPPPFNG